MAAARRLGGSLLQRAQGAERRRLVRKVISSSPAGDPVKPQADPKGKPRIFRHYPMREIQEKKEELFTLMCEAGNEYVGEWQNTHLMRYLCEHVEPRPDDPLWRRFRRGQLLTNWVSLIGPTSCVLATIPFFFR